MSRLDQLTAMLEKEPDDTFLNFGMAMELAKAERFPESLERFGRVLALDSTYVAAHFHKARTLMSMGDFDAARAELDIGIRVAGECGDLHARDEMSELRESI